MTKDMMVKALSEYFKKEGEVMGLPAYKAKGKDVPVKDYIIRKHFGSWNRFVAVIGKRYPVIIPEVAKAPVKKKTPAKEEKKDVK